LVKRYEVKVGLCVWIRHFFHEVSRCLPKNMT